MKRISIVISAALLISYQAQAAAPPLPAGLPAASTFTFAFNPDYDDGNPITPSGPVEGYIENAVIGANTDFALTATITRAGDPFTLGSGYNLLYLAGSDPAFYIDSTGRISFANAIFIRAVQGQAQEQTLTLVTPGSAAFSTGLFTTDYISTYSGQYAYNSPVEFGSITAGVPESSTWAMLIFGFGLVGAALRCRRLPSTYPA